MNFSKYTNIILPNIICVQSFVIDLYVVNYTNQKLPNYFATVHVDL